MFIIKFMMELKQQAFKLWEEKFPNQNYGFDFANSLIIKTEFQTDSPYSWDLDYYDYHDQEQFIGATKNIKIRNQQPVFIIDDIKYLVTKNPDFSYSIISANQISNDASALNFDLFHLQKIKSFQAQDFYFLSLNLKKLQPKIEENFVYNFQLILNNFFQETMIHIETTQDYKITISAMIKNNQSTLAKLMKVILKINSLIQLLIFRLKQLYQNIWIDQFENDYEQFYNLFLFKVQPNQEQPIYHQAHHQLVDFVNSFDNKIFANQNLVDDFVAQGFEKSQFRHYDQFGENIIYEYPFVNSEFYNYLKKLKA